MNQPNIDFDALRATIVGCQTIEQFVEVFDHHVPLRHALATIQNVVGNQPMERAKEWAIRMRLEGDEDRFVNECRKSVLMLLYELCNRGMDGANRSVTEESIVRIFGRDRIIVILSGCMPLDRAQCLYKMLYAVGGVYGMHWVSDEHIQHNPEYRALLETVGGRATMNKRYTWLAGIRSLELLHGNPLLTECFRLQAAPWQTRVGHDDDTNMTEQAQDVPFETLGRQINDCATIDDFRLVYDSRSFQDAIGALRRAVGTEDQIDWARDWAIRMRNEPGDDVYFNECRKICLKLLYNMCDACQDALNTSVTQESIIQKFAGHRVANILRYCFPMDRAQCLYKMMYPGKTSYGMYWVSEQHTELNPQHWNPLLQAQCGRPTMNKRLVWLRDIEALGLGQEHLVVYCLKPEEPEWAREMAEDMNE